MSEGKIFRNRLKLRKLPADANSAAGALAITTTSLPASVEGLSYNGEIFATGGTEPYIFSVISGDPPTGVSISTNGIIGGTTTTAGTYAFTVQVTDSAAGTDTQAYTVIVDELPEQSDLGGTNHTYYNTLIARPDMWKKNSFRTSTELVSLGSDGVFTSYNPDVDTDDHRQDACRFWIPAFNFITFSNSTVSQAIGISDTILHFTVVTSTYQSPRHIKIDNEIVKVQSIVSGTPGTCTVLRAQCGTAAATHSVGTAIGLSGNSADALFQSLNTNTEPVLSQVAHKYFFVWDTYYPDEWLNTGLTNHKALNFRSFAIWLEPNTLFTTSETEFNPATDVASWQNRYYGPQADSSVTQDQPILPKVYFSIKPNTWVRWFYLLEMTPTVSAFTENSTATLVSDITDPAATSITLNTATLTTTIPFFIKYSCFKIDDEIFICNADNGTKASSITVQVLRGRLGTAAATHTAGAIVKFPMNCQLSVWMADEDNDPIAVHTTVGLATNRPGAQAGDLPNVGNINLENLQFEFNTSTADPRNRFDRDLNIYVRDFVVLRDPPPADYATPGAGILLKPVSV